MTDYWTLFAAIVAVVSAAAAALIKLFNVKTGWLKQVISWLVAIGLTFAAWAIGILPSLGEPAWLYVLIQGVCVGLVSNGFYDIPAIKKFYEWLFHLGKKSEEE